MCPNLTFLPGVIMFKKKQLGVAVAASTLFLAGQLHAEERQVTALSGEDFVLEETVVTARKRAEDIQTIPIAVDTLNAATLQEKAINNLADVAKYSPGLSFETGVLPNDTRPVIRGMNISRGRPNVGILVDGVDISSETLTVAGGGAFANLSLLDLERVEVIKGPQSVTYGRSAFSGAVAYITKRPQADKGVYGFVEGETNDEGLWQGLAGVTVPLTDKLAMSANILANDFDGYYDNPNTGGDLGGYDQQGGAIAFNYEGDGDFTAFFRAEYADENYTPRAVVLRPSISNVSQPGDFFQLGSIPQGAVNMPIPGGARGLPEATAEQCAGAKPFSYLYGMPPACASMLKGDVSNVSENDIDQSPSPYTGKDFNGTKIENTRLTLDLEDQFGDISVQSLSGYTDDKTSVEEDFDLTNFPLESLGPGTATFTPGYIGPQDAAQTQFGVNTNSDTSFDYQQYSQEFRFIGEVGKLEWMGDVLYWKEDMDATMNQMWWARESMDTTYWNSILSQFVDPTCSVPGDVSTCQLFHGVQTQMTPNPIPMSRNTEHWSVAASFLYNFTDDIRATVEGRYIDESIDYESLPLDTFINGFLDMPYYNPATGSFTPEVQKQTVDETDFAPRFSVDWQVTPDVFTYASAAKGFKPGGVATTDGNGDISTGHYKPETLWAYEIGAKTELLENRLRLNGAIFYNDYTDQQVPFFITNDLGVTNVSVTNAGSSEIKGAEFEAVYRPSLNWTFTLAYTHVETEFKDFNISEVGIPSTYDKVLSGNVDGDFSGKSFTNTPEDIGIASIRYDGEFSNGMSYFAELFGKYEGKRYLDQGNLSYLGDTTLLDLSAGISNERWQVTAYVYNLTDEDSVQSGLGNVSYGFMPAGQIPPYASNLALPDKRTAGIRARYMF